MNALRAIITALLMLFALPASANDAGPLQSFDQLLAEAKLRIDTPPHFSATAVQSNSVFPYEHALRHDQGTLEVRFIIRPLSRITIDYSDPHNAAPEPEHLFPLLFESIANQLSADSDTPSSTFPEAIAQSSFNAHWAAAAAFDVDPKFSGNYQNAVLIAMHRNHVADAYTLFLYNDHERAKPLISELLSVMSFTASEL